MYTMKNVRFVVNLRRYSKSLTVGLCMLFFFLAGSAFTSFNEGEIKKSKTTDSLTSEKSSFKSLFSDTYFDPTKPAITKLNPKAVSFVQRYIQQEGEDLEKMKVWGKPYFDLYDNILPQYGLPKELKYLSVIESALIGNITSPAGAVGPWQIMAPEATCRGLVINGRKDERKSFVKSTHCAAKILKGLYAQFNDWLLVIAAYNCGDGRMRQAIRKSGSKNFWDLQAYLPKETRAHVKRFIATHYIFEGNGGLTTMTAAEILELKDDSQSDSKITDVKNMTMEVSGKFKSVIVAKNIGMSPNDFNRLNPDFDKIVASGKVYNLKLPEEKIMAFANNKNAILAECLQSYLNN